MTRSFRLLKELLSILEKNEISLLKRSFLSSSDKGLYLVQIILNDNSISEKDTIGKVYNQGQNAAFSKLVERTIEKIELVLIGMDSSGHNIYSDRNYYYFYTRRKLMAHQIKRLRGVEVDFDYHVDKIINIAKKYELYDCLIEALVNKQRYLLMIDGKISFEKIQKEINHYEEVKLKVSLAQFKLFELMSIIQSSEFNNFPISKLRDSVINLKRDFEATCSPTIGHIYYIFEVEMHQRDFNFEKADETLDKLLELTQSNPSIRTQERLAYIMANKCRNDIHLSKYKRAISFSKGFSSGLDKAVKTHDLMREIYRLNEAYARFYNNERDIAIKLVEEIISFFDLIEVQIQKKGAIVALAAMNTANLNISDSNSLLVKAQTLRISSRKFDINVKYLEIINLIESKNYEQADLKIQNFERFLKRSSKQMLLRKRVFVISRVFIKLMNEGYDFAKTYESRKQSFLLLDSKEPEYCWEHLSFELVRFQDWFKGKMKSGRETQMTSADLAE